MSDEIALALGSLVPTFEHEHGDWERVLRDARGSSRPHHFPARRLAVVAALVAAILIPLVAVAASQEWWFFRVAHTAPPAATPVVVVTEGVWDNLAWELVAYRSTTNGLCFGITLPAHRRNGIGGGLACTQVVAAPTGPGSKRSLPLGITYFAASGAALGPYVAGPVVDRASRVNIYLGSGQIVHTGTVSAPDALGMAVRFYIVRLPGRRLPSIDKLEGLDDRGAVVACLKPSPIVSSVPLSTC